MTPDAWFVFALLGVTVALFASDRIRLDLVALMVILALMLSGLLTPGEALAGFGDPVVLLIAGLFVVGDGLFRTGIAFRLGEWLMRVGGSAEARLMVLLMLVVAGLSAFMSSTGAVAIFIPVVLSLAERLGTQPSRLLMPIAYASLIGGMLTLIGTPPNLVVSNQLSREGLEPFAFFSFTPIGMLILLIGVAYMLWIGRRLLPNSERTANKRTQSSRTLEELADIYQLSDKLHRFRIPPGSHIAGGNVAKAGLRRQFGITLLGIERQGRRVSSVDPVLTDTELHGNDVVYGTSEAREMEDLRERVGLEPLPLASAQQTALSKDLGLVEVMLTPGSDLVGQTVIDARFRDRYGLSVLGIRRKDEALTRDIFQTKLRFADTLLLGGGWREIRMLRQQHQSFLVLTWPREMQDVAPYANRAPLALAIMAVMLVLMAFKIVPAVTAVLLAALAMILSGCLRMRHAYRAINWESIVLIAGMLPLATAMEKSGGMRVLVDALVGGLGGYGPTAVMGGLFVVTALFSQFISNTATTVLVAPIAVAAATGLDLSPYPFVMTVAIAASTAFSTPVASPVNTLVLGPGGYRFNDFVRVGLPLQLIVMVATLLSVPLIFRF